MKKKHSYIKIIILSLLFLLSSCKTIKNYNKESFVNQFFNNESVHLSLKKYYGNDIIIYDEKKVITNEKLKYKNDSTSINLEVVKPTTNNNFFRVHDFIVNKNLGFVVFSTFDRKQGIIFYTKKNSENNKWSIMDIDEKYAR